MKWFRLLPVVLLMLAIFLFASPVAYADDPLDDDPDMKVDVEIGGDVEVDIKARGPAELNVGVEGPSQVHIDAGDEVRVNVQASDESQVFLDDEKLDESLKLDDQSLDNPAQKPDEPAQGSVVPVISGVFPAAGLLAFFLIRRRAQKNINKRGEEVKK